MAKVRNKINIGGIALSPQHMNFVAEYIKDFSARRAAEASGMDPESGYNILTRPDVNEALQYIFNQKIDSSVIDAEWVLMEFVDNHMIARQTGNINASNTALSHIMKHKQVDAVAREKVDVSVNVNKEMVARLNRGRLRAFARDEDADASEEPSFL